MGPGRVVRAMVRWRRNQEGHARHTRVGSKATKVIDDPEELLALGRGGALLRTQFLLQAVVNHQEPPDNLPQVYAQISDQPPPVVQYIMGRAIHREAWVFRRARRIINSF